MNKQLSSCLSWISSGCKQIFIHSGPPMNEMNVLSKYPYQTIRSAHKVEFSSLWLTVWRCQIFHYHQRNKFREMACKWFTTRSPVCMSLQNRKKEMGMLHIHAKCRLFTNFTKGRPGPPKNYLSETQPGP